MKLRRLRAYWIESKYETIRLLREPSFAITFLAIPVLFYIFFGVIMAPPGVEASRATAWFVHWTVIAVAGPGLFGFGMVLAAERGQGLLTLKRALPSPRAGYLLAKVLMSMVFAGLVMTFLLVVALGWGHVELPPLRLLSLVGVNMLGSLPFCAIGLYIGVHASARTAPALVNLAYLPMMIVAGLFFPLPKSMRSLALISPQYYQDQLAQFVVGAKSAVAPALCVAVLCGLTLILFTSAVRRLARVG